MFRDLQFATRSLDLPRRKRRNIANSIQRFTSNPVKDAYDCSLSRHYREQTGFGPVKTTGKTYCNHEYIS